MIFQDEEREPGMFDLHAHVLPGVDDGPHRIEEALSVLSALAIDGVTDIVAATRLRAQHPQPNARELQERTRALEHLARQAGIAVRLYAAHEVPLDGDAEAQITTGAALPIADGPYVLLTLPSDQLPALAIGTLERLRIKGFVPIIANVCRYLPAQRNPSAVIPFVRAGALLQISAPNLAGAAGLAVQRTLRALLDMDLAHVFGSGISTPEGMPARYAEGLRLAERIAGAERVWQMVVETPNAIVSGLPVDPPAPRVAAR
jgi:protein-tyrosine phosphatase